MSASDMPRALRVVAWLCIAQGGIAIANMTCGVGGHRNVIDLSIAMLPVGLGLFTRRAGWRTFALAMFVLFQFLVVLAGIAIVAGIAVGVAGQNLGPGPVARAFGLLTAGLMFWLLQWCVRVLCRDDDRARFGVPRVAT